MLSLSLHANARGCPALVYGLPCLAASDTTSILTCASCRRSWGHQGIYLDTDGTLINGANLALPAEVAASPPFPLTSKGITFHSAVESQLFDPSECVYLPHSGAICKPELTFRR